jgi:DNA-binding MarR family transcriptional regulator
MYDGPFLILKIPDRPHFSIMNEQPELPWDAFYVISTILNRFIGVLADCEISMPQLYVLAYIKHCGKNREDGNWLALRSEITKVLQDEFGHPPKYVTRDVRKLEKIGLVKAAKLEPNEKQLLFGTKKGLKSAVVLLDAGQHTIDQFSARVHQIYLELTNPLSPGADNRLIKSIGNWLLHQKV